MLETAHWPAVTKAGLKAILVVATGLGHGQLHLVRVRLQRG
jgi:hypothetical protein